METDPAKIREAIQDSADEIKAEIDAGNLDADEPHDAIFEYTDSTFGVLVQQCMVAEYDVDDMIRTAPSCAAIISVAKEDAWVEDDAGMWTNDCQYGVLAAIAFGSLEHCIWQKLRDMCVIDE